MTQATRNVQQQLQTALAHLQGGRPESALALLESLQTAAPGGLETTYLAGIAKSQLGRYEEALEDFRAVSRMRDDFPDLHDHAGQALLALGRVDEAIASFSRALELAPDHASACNNIGNAHAAQGRHREAESWFRRAIAAAPNTPELHFNLGNALKSDGRHEAAIRAYQRAIELRPEYVQAHNNQANALVQLERFDPAIAAYRRAVAAEPRYAEAQANLAKTLQDAHRFPEALAAVEAALEHSPEAPELLAHKGNILRALKQPRAAIAALEDALASNPRLAAAHACLGNARWDLGDHPGAISAYEAALSALEAVDQPGLDDAGRAQLGAHALAMGAYARRMICDWTDHQELSDRMDQRVAAGDPVPPFCYLAFCDDPTMIHACARAYGARKTRAIEPLAPRRPTDDHGRMRIGYLSPDFRNHAVAKQMAEMFECHDRAGFELHALSYGTDDGSQIRQRLQHAFENWHELAELEDREIAARINDLGIDILVDLAGYTAFSRPAILAFRPAPIQATFVGYPGTLGLSCVDYLIGDRVVLPTDRADAHAEQPVRLPHFYMPFDRKQPAPRPVSRADCDLPEDALVLCCFNSVYKITPAVFAVWMRLLKAIPDAVLWISTDQAEAIDNLRREARRADVDPARLVVSGKSLYDEYLGRLACADLFLDTLPYTAHGTATDAVRASLPLLTVAGRSFHSRVATSVLTVAGLPELVTADLEEYAALALELASDRSRLAGLRERLNGLGSDHPLFDAQRFARDLEQAFQLMWERRADAPAGITIAFASPPGS